MGALAIVVLWGMVAGLDRSWESGTASVGGMIVQEAFGVLAVATLAFALWRLRILWRGTGGWAAARAMLAALICSAAWVLAYAVEFSS